MNFAHKRVPLDEKEKAKIVSLRRDHGVSLSDLAIRFGRTLKTVKGALEEGGIVANRPSGADTLTRALALIEQAARAGERCPMNDQIPGGATSMSKLARQGLIFVEVYVHNFRRVTILAGDHKGKSTVGPPKYAGKNPAPYLTVGLVTKRNGSPLDTRRTWEAQQ